MLIRIQKRPRLFAIFGFAALSAAVIDNPAQDFVQDAFYQVRSGHYASQQSDALHSKGLQDLVTFDHNRAATFNDSVLINDLQSFSPDETQDLDKNIYDALNKLPAFIQKFLSEFDVKTKSGRLVSSINHELGTAIGRGSRGKTNDEFAQALSVQNTREIIIPANNLVSGNTLSPTPLQDSPQRTNEVLLHEISHILDVQTGRRSKDRDFLEAVQSDLHHLNWRTRRYVRRIVQEAGLPQDPEAILQMPAQELATQLDGIANPQTFRASLSDGYMNVRSYLRSRHFGSGAQDTLEASASEIYAALGSIYLYRLQNNPIPHAENKLANELPRSYALVSRQMQMLEGYYEVAYARPFMTPPPT